MHCHSNGVINLKTQIEDMKKNYFVYYATEENAYEIEKNGAFTESEAVECVKEYLDEYMPNEDIADAMADVNTNKAEGVNLIFEDKYKGYTMCVAIAPKGKLRGIRNELSDMRREIEEMFY